MKFWQTLLEVHDPMVPDNLYQQFFQKIHRIPDSWNVSLIIKLGSVT